MSGEFIISLFCLSAVKFDAIDGPVLQLSFIWQAKENTSLRCESGLTKRCKEKRGWRLNSFSSFYMFYLLPMSLPYVNWASQEGCLFYLRFSLGSSDLPLFYFHGLFPSLSSSHCHFGLLFPILTTSQYKY